MIRVNPFLLSRVWTAPDKTACGRAGYTEDLSLLRAQLYAKAIRASVKERGLGLFRG